MFTAEEQIEQKILKSLKDRDRFKLNAYRLIKAAIQNERIFKGKDFSSEDLIKVLRREFNKRQEAAEAFGRGGNKTAADNELLEAKIIAELLPEELSEEKITAIVQQVISEQGFSGPQSFGPAMKLVMAKIGSRANGSVVSKLLKQQLAEIEYAGTW